MSSIRLAVYWRRCLLSLLSCAAIGGSAVAWASLTQIVQNDALVVGVSHYQNPERQLQGTAKDVERMRKFLEAAGYRVTVLVDPTSAKLQEAVEQFTTVLGGARRNERVVYFSGNAGAIDGNALLFPVDVDPKKPAAQGVDLNKTLTKLQSKTDQLTVIVDSQPFEGLDAQERGIRLGPLKASTTFVAAAAPGFVAEDTKAGGEFTDALLLEVTPEQFKGVDWVDLIERVGKRMRRARPEAMPFLIPAVPVRF